MSMPEAAVDEYRLAAQSEGEVRSSWEVMGVETVPIAHSMHESPNLQLRLGVLRADTCHPFAALAGGQRVEATVSQIYKA